MEQLGSFKHLIGLRMFAVSGQVSSHGWRRCAPKTSLPAWTASP